MATSSNIRLQDILAPDRVLVAGEDGPTITSKAEALRCLSLLLARGTSEVLPDEIERVLVDRERVQSTGIGCGVAIPHGASARIQSVCAAALICPSGVAFESIDDRPVAIVFGIFGPERCPEEHLRALAHVSRLLRNQVVRDSLCGAHRGIEACDRLLAAEQQALVSTLV